MKLLRSAVMLGITFMAALTLAVPCAAAAQTWVYDSSAKTLTLQGTAVVINNVTTSGAGTLTIGRGNERFAHDEIDLTTIVDAGNQTYTVTLIDSGAFSDQTNANNSIKSVTAPHVKKIRCWCI